MNAASKPESAITVHRDGTITADASKINGREFMRAIICHPMNEWDRMIADAKRRGDVHLIPRIEEARRLTEAAFPRAAK